MPGLMKVFCTFKRGQYDFVKFTLINTSVLRRSILNSRVLCMTYCIKIGQTFDFGHFWEPNFFSSKIVRTKILLLFLYSEPSKGITNPFTATSNATNCLTTLKICKKYTMVNYIKGGTTFNFGTFNKKTLVMEIQAPKHMPKYSAATAAASVTRQMSGKKHGPRQAGGRTEGYSTRNHIN